MIEARQGIGALTAFPTHQTPLVRCEDEHRFPIMGRHLSPTKEHAMQNKETKTNKQREKQSPQAGLGSKGRHETDTVEKEKAADTQSEFNVNQRRQESYKEQ